MFVEARNKGDSPITIPFGGETFTIEPGKKRIVPWEAVASMFGDPSIKNDGRNRYRDEVYTRTRAGLNFYIGFTTEQEWEEVLKPKIEFYDADNPKDRIYTLIDDPTGELGGTIPTFEADTQTQILLLQEQIQQLTRIIADKKLPEAEDPPTHEIPPAATTDIPKPKATTKAKVDAPGDLIRNE